MGAFAYVAWQLKLEQEDHKATRMASEVQNEKRLALHVENLRTLAELKQAIDNLAKEVRRVKRGQRDYEAG